MKRLIYLVYAWSRLGKMLFYCIERFSRKIYSPHGAFIIINKKALKNLIPLFNEGMFLFYEENHLGKKACLSGIAVVYEPKIKIKHKEDGSVSFLSQSQFSLMRQSYMTYYEYWRK